MKIQCIIRIDEMGHNTNIHPMVRYKFATWTSKGILMRQINKLLRELDLPEDPLHDASNKTEEDLFMRAYDIKTFGHNPDHYIRSQWIKEERLLSSMHFLQLR